MMLPFTYLFVPGNRPERFAKAQAVGAGAIILDLEDAVAPESKAAARSEIARWCSSQNDAANIVLRINDRQSPWFADDLALLRDSRIRLVMLPKTESANDVAAVLAALQQECEVLPLIETARGVRCVEEIAAAAGVQRIVFGTIDYALEMNLSGDERGLIYPASQIALASRCAGIPAPVAGVTLAIDDEAALLADLAFARVFGFGAKLCIHPRQVAPIERAMAPTEKEIGWAQRVVAEASSGQGAVQVDGKMVDRPVLLQAEAILMRAGRR
ncbi:MAG: CoA ester lyase [Burkholderiaceae bacterium]|nr:CoA ester lyase [Burkholderiaceae bacterium]